MRVIKNKLQKQRGDAQEKALRLLWNEVRELKQQITTPKNWYEEEIEMKMGRRRKERQKWGYKRLKERKIERLKERKKDWKKERTKKRKRQKEDDGRSDGGWRCKKFIFNTTTIY